MSAWFLNGRNCVLPDPNQYGPEADRALSFFCPVGREPSRAYVIITKEDLLAHSAVIDAPFTLKLTDRDQFGRPVEASFTGLYWVKAIRIGGGHPSASTGDYLVELADLRWLWSRWSVMDSDYNVRRPAPAASSGVGLYYSSSLTGGSFWTWSEMCGDIWTRLPGAGAFPNLPYNPDGIPYNFRFRGVNALDALQEVLGRINCAIARNPITGAWSIVYLGAAQTGLVDAELLVKDAWLDNADPLQSGAARYPETVRVFFNRQAVHHGTEKDTVGDGQNWDTQSIYSKDIATNKNGALAGTIAALWDDLPVEIKFDGTRNNQSSLDDRATERAAKYLASLDRGQLARIVYTGLIKTILPGSQIKAVKWSQGANQGLRTETIRYDGAPSGTGCGGLDQWPSVGEHMTPPDYARRSFPLWPRLLQPVQIWDDEEDVGADLTPESNGLWKGRVLRLDPGGTLVGTNDAWDPLDDCWIAVANYPAGGSYDSTAKLPNGQRFLGRLNGSATISGTTKPLYLIHGDDLAARFVRFTANEDMSETNDNQMEVTVEDYWGGGNPADGSGNLIVYDATTPAMTPGFQFRNVREGDTGYAVYNTHTGSGGPRWEVISALQHLYGCASTELATLPEDGVTPELLTDTETNDHAKLTFNYNAFFLINYECVFKLTDPGTVFGAHGVPFSSADIDIYGIQPLVVTRSFEMNIIIDPTESWYRCAPVTYAASWVIPCSVGQEIEAIVSSSDGLTVISHNLTATMIPRPTV